jgi:DNA-binding XRE family transcriptional regulator
VAIATSGNSTLPGFPGILQIATSGNSPYNEGVGTGLILGGFMTFADKLRELRDAAGLSEAKLAKLSGVPFASLHDYGLGRRKPSLAAAAKIARALGVTCEAFMECEDVAGAPPPPEKSKAPKPRRPRGT